jgi:hypothetical protein
MITWHYVANSSESSLHAMALLSSRCDTPLLLLYIVHARSICTATDITTVLATAAHAASVFLESIAAVGAVSVLLSSNICSR